MQDFEQKILEQYDIEVNSTRKVRGAVLCDTDKGLCLLKQVNISEKRFPALGDLYEYLVEQGYTQIDNPVRNKNGTYLSSLESGEKYILKRWFAARECEVKKNAEVFEASGNLAKLHILMRHKMENEPAAGPELSGKYQRHNRELKKIRQFSRKVVRKEEFELAFLKHFDEMYEWAEAAQEALLESGYEKLYRDSMERCSMIHGEYNYHNVLFLHGKIATTNFEKCRRDIQMEDLYYFLRKVMEKNGWKIRIGDGMLNAYSAILPLTKEEITYLKVRLIYPEKFWKIANSYYNTNKAWVAVKNIEKLQTAVRQEEDKKYFLKEVLGFTL